MQFYKSPKGCIIAQEKSVNALHNPYSICVHLPPSLVDTNAIFVEILHQAVSKDNFKTNQEL